jgi:hypothetical protein
VLAAKLLGTYECEIHPCLEEVLAQHWDNVVVLGAAEGYYAVGIARRLQNTHITSYDLSEFAQSELRRIAQMNGVASRITVRGGCGVADLAALQPGRTFLLVDVEGAEMELIQPGKLPALGQATLLVELHPHLAPGSVEALLARLEPTHELRVIPPIPRPSPRAWKGPLGLLGARSLQKALQEELRHAGQSFLWATPRLPAAS